MAENALSIKVDMSAVDQILWGLLQDVYSIHSHVISDIKRNVPGHIAGTVSKKYNVKKSEVLACLAKRRADEYHRGRNARRANTRFSVRGHRLTSMQFVFTAASWQYWETWSKALDRKTLRQKKKEGKLEDYLRARAAEGNILPADQAKRKKNFRGKNAKQYWVKVETYKNQPATWQATDAYRVFTLFRGGENRLAVAKKGERKYLLPKSSSIPQAILNPEVVSVWQPYLEKYIGDRIVHHAKQYLNGSNYIR